MVGAVPAGLPKLTIPLVSFQDILALLPAAFALTILIYADEIHGPGLCKPACTGIYFYR